MNMTSTLAAAAALTCCTLAQAAMPQYTLSLLSDLAGGMDSAQAQAINNLGVAAGQAHDGNYLAALWQPGQGATSLGDLAGGITNSHAYAINDSNWVVGTAAASTGTRAFLWKQGTGMLNLGDLPGGTDFSGAYGINNAGAVVGYSYNTTGLDPKAVIWDAKTLQMTQLGDLAGGANSSVARDINNGNQVVGYSSIATGQHAFRWSAEGGMVDLGDLAGGMDSSMAYAVNDSGWVAGTGVAGNNVQHAVVWSPDGQMIDLGALLGASSSTAALDINARGEVIGTGAGKAFLWSQAGGIVDLNAVTERNGFVLGNVWAINDQGQIAGWGTNASGGRQAFVISPLAAVPEPETYALMLGGLGAIGLVSRRRLVKKA